MSIIDRFKTYANFVKFAHTIFALPFALAGYAVAHVVPLDIRDVRIGDYPAFDIEILGLVLLCMVGARSFAMGINRIVDRHIDAKNPRTAVREMPSGKMSLKAAWLFTLFMGGLYFGACALLGQVVLWLSPIPIALMVLYPYCKRFTSLCHLVLGACLGLAPVGAWVAVRSAWYIDYVLPGDDTQHTFLYGWDAVPEPWAWVLGAAVMFWVAGFDVIYALQDDEFDREHKLHSIPAKFGRKRALLISRAMHVLSIAGFFVFAWMLTDGLHGPSLPYWVYGAPATMAVGMLYQHSLVRHDDLKHVNLAFFTVNGVISVIFGAIVCLAVLLG